jgi:cytochrome c553
MKKGIAIVATSLLLFVGCTEDKKEAKEQVTPKQEVTQNVEEKAKEVKTEVKVEEKKAEEAKQAKIEQKAEQVNETASNELNAETLFKTCASCHGLKGEKEALGKSQVITGWDKDRVIKALNGYKDGSYGGVMKNLMKTHVETKTPEQIEVLADYISKLQ